MRLLGKRWCPGEDSNLHDLRHWYLKPARLPIPPPGLRGLPERRVAASSRPVTSRLLGGGADVNASARLRLRNFAGIFTIPPKPADPAPSVFCAPRALSPFQPVDNWSGAESLAGIDVSGFARRCRFGLVRGGRRRGGSGGVSMRPAGQARRRGAGALFPAPRSSRRAVTQRQSRTSVGQRADGECRPADPARPLCSRRIAADGGRRLPSGAFLSVPQMTAARRAGSRAPAAAPRARRRRVAPSRRSAMP